MLGDFNFPNITWDDDIYRSRCKDVQKFLNVLTDYAFMQLNRNPSTKHGHILDLVLSNFPDVFSCVEKADSEFSSDHFIMSFMIRLQTKNPNALYKYVHNYSKANFDIIKEKLVNANLSDIILNSKNVEEAWGTWYENVVAIINEYVLKTWRYLSKKCNAPRFDGTVHTLRNKKTMPGALPSGKTLVVNGLSAENYVTH